MITFSRQRTSRNTSCSTPSIRTTCSAPTWPTGLPRTLILSAELCPLRDEDEAFAKRLSDAGTPAACYRMRDAMHGYLLYPTSAETTKISLGICRSFLDGEALTQGTDSTWLEILGIA